MLHFSGTDALGDSVTTPTTFAALGCSEALLSALNGRGFTTPTPVQAESFGPGLEGRDLLVQSRTGSGKTLAFGLPLLHRLGPDRVSQAIVLTPTRELAQQVAEELRSVDPRLDVALLVGGSSYTPQLRALKYGAPVVVGTPGRIMDHLERGTLDLSTVSMVVLDECDEMLNMGFLEDVESILSKVEGHPQTYLFSATLPGPIAALAKRFLQNPHRVQLSQAGEAGAHQDIAHTAALVPNFLHGKALVNLLLQDEPSAALIFTKTKQQTEEVTEILRESGLSADYLHGDLNQNARNRILASFKEGRLRYLVATDVAARGLDIQDLPLVVHLGIPTQLEPYVHRSGRTGRAGSKGTSLALVDGKESRILLAWGRRGGFQLQWRPVPKPAEVAQARAARLVEKLRAADGIPKAAQARQLLEAFPPEALVAALLSLQDQGAFAGYDVPDAPKREFRTEAPKREFRPDGPKKPWTPRAREDGGDRPYAKGFDRGPRREDDKAFGPRKPFNSFKPKPDRRSGEPFFKRKKEA